MNKTNMNQTAIFRCLILASLVLAVLGSLVDFLMPDLFPKEIDEAYTAYLAEEPELWVALAMGAFAIIVFVGAIVGTVGLWLFKRWSRGLSFWLTVVSMASYPFLGPVLYSGWAFLADRARDDAVGSGSRHGLLLRAEAAIRWRGRDRVRLLFIPLAAWRHAPPHLPRSYLPLQAPARESRC